MINIKFAPKKKEYITSETLFAVGNHIIFFILSFPIFPHQAVRPESIRLLTAYSYIVYRFYAFVNLCIKSKPPLVMHHAPRKFFLTFAAHFARAAFIRFRSAFSAWRNFYSTSPLTFCFSFFKTSPAPRSFSKAVFAAE